mgnify:CR=1 FL=1
MVLTILALFAVACISTRVENHNSRDACSIDPRPGVPGGAIAVPVWNPEFLEIDALIRRHVREVRYGRAICARKQVVSGTRWYITYQVGTRWWNVDVVDQPWLNKVKILSVKPADEDDNY